MSKSSGKNEPDKDPYHVLGLHTTATDVEITKAYRKLALQLHPDKQQQKPEKESKRAAEQFHDIQQARSFLLDEEHRQAREKYKTKRVSQQVRKTADQAREKGMSERRKRMREELHRQEAAATGKQTSTGRTGDDSSRKRGRRHQQQQTTENADLVEQLRRQGQEMREAYGDRAAAESVDRQTAADLKKRPTKPALDDRQVRLKWSRKRMRTSPSEHSLAATLSKFGAVELVEMIGSKGNAALVTFTDAGSVAPCVNAYKDSEEMRATYVGKRKEREEESEANADAPPPIPTERGRDGENVNDWKLRQAADRERLSRELEEEDTGKGAAVDTDKRQKARKPSQGTSQSFPPPFPSTDDYKNLSPLEKLQHAESLLLKGIVSPERLQRSKVVTRQ
jgi:DnaJ family protein C protein 17